MAHGTTGEIDIDTPRDNKSRVLKLYQVEDSMLDVAYSFGGFVLAYMSFL